MENKLVRLSLSSDNYADMPRDCLMSIDLYQNACMTMGELRDLMRQLGISWDFIKHQIDRANRPVSPLARALDSMDEYSTGTGHSLRDLPSNIF